VKRAACRSGAQRQADLLRFRRNEHSSRGIHRATGSVEAESANCRVCSTLRDRGLRAPQTGARRRRQRPPGPREDQDPATLLKNSPIASLRAARVRCTPGIRGGQPPCWWPGGWPGPRPWGSARAAHSQRTGAMRASGPAGHRPTQRCGGSWPSSRQAQHGVLASAASASLHPAASCQLR